MKRVQWSPARHRTLFHAKHQAARLRLLEERHVRRFEVGEVLVHAEALVPPDEHADSGNLQQYGSIEHASQELVLCTAQCRIVVQQVVEVAKVRQADAGATHRRLYAPRAGPVERLPQIQRVRQGIEHGFCWHVRQRRMDSGRQLNRVHPQAARVDEPVFNRAVGILVAHGARSQFLEGSSQDTDRHEHRVERANVHSVIQMPSALALASTASTMCWARQPSAKEANAGGRSAISWFAEIVV